MPRYIYKCNSCEQEFEVSHGMNDSLSECTKCGGKDCLFKISQFSISRKITDANQNKKVGSVVNKYIKDAKKDLRQQKLERKKEEFK